MMTNILGLDMLYVGDHETLKYLFNHPQVQNRKSNLLILKLYKFSFYLDLFGRNLLLHRKHMFGEKKKQLNFFKFSALISYPSTLTASFQFV